MAFMYKKNAAQCLNQPYSLKTTIYLAGFRQFLFLEGICVIFEYLQDIILCPKTCAGNTSSKMQNLL